MAASNYIGRNLSDGVRGATINAIASSMPEVFTSLFFLFVLKDAEGFSGGIGTTAGSAVFNSMIIPAASVIAVTTMVATKKVRVSRKVLLRDGVALILAELIFLILIGGSRLAWYHGFILMMIYGVYIVFTLLSMRKKEKEEEEAVEETEETEGMTNLSLTKAIFTLDLEKVFIRGHIRNTNAWPLLIVSTLAIALVCYLLVLACEWIGSDRYVIPYLGEFKGLNIPVMFVALILAAAASSFPDTMISIRDARDGKYADAISNALGSNIFDICFALGLPLFIFTLVHGPIEVPPAMVDLSGELRLLLWLLTVLVVGIFVSGDYIGKRKATLLIILYCLFVCYVVGRSIGQDWALAISDFLVSIVKYFRIQ